MGSGAVNRPVEVTEKGNEVCTGLMGHTTLSGYQGVRICQVAIFTKDSSGPGKMVVGPASHLGRFPHGP